MYRILLIVLSLVIILLPFTGLPGGLEDILMQFFGVCVLLLVLLLPKRESKKEMVVEDHDI